MNLFTKENSKLTNLENKLMVTMGERLVGIVREFGTDMYTLLDFKWITNKGTVQHRELTTFCILLPNKSDNILVKKKLCSNLSGKRIGKVIDTCLFITLPYT